MKSLPSVAADTLARHGCRGNLMTMDNRLIAEMAVTGRKISLAEKDDPYLGPLRFLPGSWKNTDELKGYGFNMIALPFVFDPQSNQENGYRLLINQYDEVLSFDLFDRGIPNRGVQKMEDGSTRQADQTVVGLSYEQIITQISFEDSFLESFSEKESKVSKTNISEIFNGHPIHHEPGLWLHMTNFNQNDEFDGNEIVVARSGSIPHGNSFLAPGTVKEIRWEDLRPEQQARGFIPGINGVVVGGGSDPDERPLDPIFRKDGTIGVDYFAPYRFFHQNPFKGQQLIPGFSGFDPVHSTALLKHAFDEILKRIGRINHSVILEVDTTLDHTGIHRSANPNISNTPFIARQADTTALKATFIVYEIEDANSGELRYFLQYAQNVMLDFINRPDGHPGRARWPHVSINTLERVSAANPKAIVESLR
jgi:hypothetical protein